MESVAEVFGDAVTPEVAEGWSEAVMHLAGILIDAEVTLLPVVFRFACTLDEQFTPYGFSSLHMAYVPRPAHWIPPLLAWLILFLLG